MHIGDIITRHARYRPDHVAVVFEEHRLTYRQFNTRLNRLANALLGLGIRKGDKIATIVPNRLEVLDIYWAAAKIGVVVVPLSTLLRAPALVTLLQDSDTVAVFAEDDVLTLLESLRAGLPAIARDRMITLSSGTGGWRTYADLVSAASPDEPPDADLTADDLYNIIYSSGTTGLPKGIMHTHFVRAMYCLTFATAFRIMPESIILHAGSIAFNGSFLSLMPAFFQGATYILHPHFDVERVVQTIADEKVTHIVMVPSQIVALLHSPSFDPARLRSLEMICTVGAPLHLEHKQRLNDALPGVFYELYGLTEGFSTILDKTMYAAKPGSVGAPPPFYQIKIVDADGRELPPGQVGEIAGRGPKIMTGYYKRPDLTAAVLRDGWLYTGDLGYLDEDGYLYLVDRKKDMIISGGINVYPRDIEEILVQHPDVVEAAVFGVPDKKWGETPVAAVVLRPGCDTPPAAIRDWLNQRVHAVYQRVSEVIIRDTFPRSAAGKTLKRVMRDEFLHENQS
ncbi:MAG: AMP-binding protein [Chloroflexi bacterium]|nr:AMP-binding protein [Chloroflexota bacterium]